MGSLGFRGRILLALLLAAIVPSGALLVVGTAALREAVESTGSAGAWDQVARSGQELFDELSTVDDPSPELLSIAQQHRDELAESVRLSHAYGFLVERFLALLPALAVVLLVLVGALALLAANRFSRDFSKPVDEVVAWTRALGSGEPLPGPDRGRGRPEMREFTILKEALRETADRLEVARLREADRIRTQSWTEMARRVAHDLKNPLTPMRMAAERVAGAEDPKVAEAGEVLREEIDRLDALARTFSQFGRPPEGPTAPVDLRELLSTIARRLSTAEIPVEFRGPDHPLEVRGHLEALERIARNLVANAQEATVQGPGGRPVEIVLRPLETGAEIRVLDRGPGIPESMLSRIWQPEFTSKTRGTGLGLALVGQAVRAHGGEVSAANREGGGAEFVIRLPFRPPDPPPAAVPTPAVHGGTRE